MRAISGHKPSPPHTALKEGLIMGIKSAAAAPSPAAPNAEAFRICSTLAYAEGVFAEEQREEEREMVRKVRLQVFHKYLEGGPSAKPMRRAPFPILSPGFIATMDEEEITRWAEEYINS